MVTKSKLTEVAKSVNNWTSFQWVGAIVLSFVLNPLFAFLGAFSIIPVVIILIAYFHFTDKAIITKVVDKAVAESV
jgi:hypothetical protein